MLSWRKGRGAAEEGEDGEGSRVDGAAVRAMWIRARNGRCPQWTRTWLEAGLVLGLWLLCVGVTWVVVFEVMRHLEAAVAAAEWVGVGMAAVGGLLVAAIGVRALRDDEHLECPVCGRPMSKWRFLGTYFPRHTDQPPGKGHTKCLQCALCRRPVVRDAWDGAPPDRKYHRECWDAQCARACSEPEFGP